MVWDSTLRVDVLISIPKEGILNSINYNIPIIVRLGGNLNIKALETSLNQLIARHASFRTVFTKDKTGVGVQKVLDKLELNLVSEKLDHKAKGKALEKIIKAEINKEISTPFDFIKGPLIRVRLFEVKQGEHVLVFNHHHIISDGVSVDIILKELSEFYQANIEKREPKLDKLPIQYVDFAAWQRAEFKKPEFQDKLKYWKDTLGNYDLNGISNRIKKFNNDHFDTKKGLAVMPVCFGISFTTTFMNQASALVHIYTDGSVSVTTGGIEMGQGLNTNILKITAETLGIGSDRIKIESTNTTRIANMSPSAASSTTLLNGNATVLAINQILSRIKTFAAEELGFTEKDNITISSEKILYKGENTGMTWNELIQKAYLARIGLSAHAFFATPDIWFDKKKEQGEPFAYHVVGAAIIEVTLDCLKGIYDIDSVKIVHDLGRPLNKRVDLGQIEGGLAQGLGWVTMEDLQYDEKGILLSNALASYKVPDVYFMPDDIQVTFLEDADSDLGPYGSKAVGEPPLMYGIGAFFALRNAMKSFRPDLEFPHTSPLTPERILMSLYPEFLNDIKKYDSQSISLAEEIV